MENKSDRQMAALTGERIGSILPRLAELEESEDAVLVHEQRDSESVVICPADLLKLTETGREIYSDLLNAQVKEIRSADHGLEIVICGVEPEEMERFCEDFAAFEEAEELMGPTM